MYVVRAATVLAALVGPTARLPVRRAAMPVCMAGPPVDALSYPQPTSLVAMVSNRVFGHARGRGRGRGRGRTQVEAAL